ncbi:metallophosphoesterase [Streptomyces sp. NPDC086777]|uniref:metallophosphoesterase family protein n=1 Tax=Streptomyces sp. NPDC086777 TaxID=3154866 RepID=UPI003450C184
MKKIMHRIVALAAVSVMATAVPAGAAIAGPTSGSAGPRPPKPTAPPGAGLNGEAWAWTQLTSQGTRIRYVSTDDSLMCPSVLLTVGAQPPSSIPMRLVSTPMGAQFPTTVCELGGTTGIPLAASKAELDPTTLHAATLHPGRQLPLPKWTASTRPAKIGVIGDTGCSVPARGQVQSCRTEWPFGRIATSLATVTQPDLVIHTGDYLYREDPSREDDKASNPGCQTSSQAASWDCVVADFFRPAETLLAKAPVALTRGNHEDCNQPHQGGAGGAWFRYLADVLRSNGSCSDFTPPAFIRAGTLNLVNVDSSQADPNDNGSTANLGRFTGYFDAVNQNAAQPGRTNQDYFVFTHKPLWMVKAAAPPPNPGVEAPTRVLAAAVGNTNLGRLRDNVRLVLSGHIHLYQMLDFNTSRPPQLTVGSAGGPLDMGPVDGNANGKMIGTPLQVVNQTMTQEQTPGGLGIFGYADLRDVGGTWDLVFRDSNGVPQGYPPGGQSCKVTRLTTDLAHKSFVCQ